MSQYSTSQDSRIRRNAGRDVPQTGITETPNAPGLVPLPPVSAGANVANQVLNALAAAGQASESFAVYENQRRIAAAREDAKLKEMQDAADSQIRGLAALKSHTSAEELISQFKSGELRPNTGEKYTDFVDRLVAAGTEGQGPVYTEQYNKIKPQLLNAAFDQERMFKERAANEGFALSAEDIYANPSPAHALQVKAALMRAHPEMSEREILSKTFLPAVMKIAAVPGKPEELDKALNILGNNFADKKVEARVIRQHVNEAAQVDTDQAFHNDIASMYNSNQSVDVIRDRIKSWSGRAQENTIQTESQQLDAFAHRKSQELAAAGVKTDVALWEKSVLAQDATAIVAGTGYDIIGPKKYTDALGHDHTRTENERRSDGYDAIFNQIDQRAPSKEAAFAQKADLASKGNYPVPQWKSAVEAGVSAASQIAVTQGDKGGVSTIPPGTKEGLNVYRTLKNQNPSYLAQHIATDRRVEDFYELALSFRLDPSVPDDETAILWATRAFANPISIDVARVKASDAITAASSLDPFFGGDIHNSTEVASEIYSRTIAYTRLGMSPTEAVKRATDIIKNQGQILNDQWVRTNVSGLPDTTVKNLNPIVKSMANDWAAVHGEALGVSANDLTATRTPDGLWSLVLKSNGLPPRNTPDIIFTNKDIIDRNDKLAKDKTEKVVEQSRKGATAVVKSLTAQRPVIDVPPSPSSRPEY